MDEYVIGAGAVLAAGPHATIAPAALHARTDPRLARGVTAALIDFEGVDAGELSRVLVVAAGWTAARFDAGVVQPLLARGTCTLGDVLVLLAAATGTREVHVFARWLLDEATCASLRAHGIIAIAHPLETIEQAALVTGQRVIRWKSNPRAA